MEASEVGYASLQDDVCNLESIAETSDREGRCVCVVELEVNLFSFGGVDEHPLVRSDLIVDETYAGGHSPQSSFSSTTGLTMRSWPARAISRSSPQSGHDTISPFTASSGTETRASQSGHFSLDKVSPPILSKFSRLQLVLLYRLGFFLWPRQKLGLGQSLLCVCKHCWHCPYFYEAVRPGLVECAG